MRSRWLTCLGVAAACGRLAFDERTQGDAPIDIGSADAPPKMPALVAFTGSSTGDPATPPANLQVTIPAVAAGDLLVVAIANHYGGMVASIGDGSHSLVPSDTPQINGIASELWYSGSAAGVTSLTVTTQSPNNFDVWVAEFSNVQITPVSVAGQCAPYPPALEMVPDTTTVPSSLVFSVLMAQYPLYVGDTQPPWTSLGPQTGNGAGYIVAAQPGTYTAQYSIAQGSGMTAETCESTAVWVPTL